MIRIRHVALAVAGVLVSFNLHAGSFADAVIGYNSGTGFSAGYTDPNAALGSPSTQTVDPDPVFGGTFPVDPFDPPYLASQLVSVGAGGSLTVHFSSPVFNRPGNPYGIDFLVFGNAGFVITNGNFSGGGITDGSLFAANPGSTRVSVSADNVTYYTLNPSLAPIVDGFFPLDGGGNFQTPVNPALTGNSFAGRDLAGIRALYGGSGGGAGFDLAWAQDSQGQSVSLASVSYVRVEVLGGKSEIDAFVGVPEPSVWTLTTLGFSALAWRRSWKRR